MKHTLKWIAAGAAAAALTCGAPFSLASPATPESTAWQHHSAKFNYSGFTSAYTCEGMEGKVRQIMQFLGARKDMTINASGCPRGPNSPSHMVWVTLEFDTLAPAAAERTCTELRHMIEDPVAFRARLTFPAKLRSSSPAPLSRA